MKKNSVDRPPFGDTCPHWPPKVEVLEPSIVVAVQPAENSRPVAGHTDHRRCVCLTDITKHSLDFLRPIKSTEAFEAVDWLAGLPQRRWP